MRRIDDTKVHKDENVTFNYDLFVYSNCLPSSNSLACLSSDSRFGDNVRMVGDAGEGNESLIIFLSNSNKSNEDNGSTFNFLSDYKNLIWNI
jgi:hypothetical protein